MLRRTLLSGLLAPMVLDPVRGWASGIGTVASFSILADMVRRVGGGRLEVVSLVPPDADAHAYQPTASDSRALTRAALLVENGLGLEGWMTRLSAASNFRGEIERRIFLARQSGRGFSQRPADRALPLRLARLEPLQSQSWDGDSCRGAS